VVQLHTADYRHPAQIPDGSVLVVGGGNSGFQIAAELAGEGRTVALAEGRRNACVPQRPLGRDIFWWQGKFGLLQKTADSSFGQRMKANDGTVIGSSRRGLARLGVTLRPRLVRAEGRSVEFADGATAEVDAVVWATGFVIDDSWIDVPGVLDERDRLVQTRGVVAGVPGLYTLGRVWQHTIGSSLLGFVKHDAEWLSRRIVEERAAR
jgi:putative flavoprotein involved in K+ transport